MRPALAYLAGEVELLARAGLLRTWRPASVSEGMLDACSNDYLGYGLQSYVAGPARQTGARGSRLITGDSAVVCDLEDEVASWVGQERALTFTSGYAANVGVMSAIAEAGDLVVSDERNHASLIDGCRLSRAAVRVTAHRDVGEVARALREGSFRRRWVVVESYYSMDGTVSDVAGLRDVCDRAGAGLIVDEAHALGVFGQGGGGICRREGVGADVLVGTFGKAVGVQGAFVAGEALVRQWLWNRARSFVYSTGLSPMLGSVVLQNVRRARADEVGRRRVWDYAALVRGRLREAGLAVVAGSCGPIIAVLAGQSATCLEWERRLAARGVNVRGIRPPTVAEGSARLRVTVSASMKSQDVARLASALVECAR